MDLEQVRELLKIVADSGVAEVEIEEEDFKLVVRKNSPSVNMQPPMPAFAPYPMAYPAPLPPAYAPPPAAPAAPVLPSAAPAPVVEAAPAAPPSNTNPVKAPIVGTFYRSPSPDAGPFVQVGDKVKPGDVLCIIEAMKLMNEIECEMAGTIREILVDNATPVEYDQTLFLIEPA